MKKILYVTPKENIELSYPNFLSPIMKMIYKHLKVKTIKNLKTGSKIKLVCFDEWEKI